MPSICAPIAIRPALRDSIAILWPGCSSILAAGTTTLSMHCARGRSFQSELILGRGNLETRCVALHDKAANVAVVRARIRENKKEAAVI